MIVMRMQKNKRTKKSQGQIPHGAALFINVSFNKKTTSEIASVILQNPKVKNPGKAIPIKIQTGNLEAF